jgi:competence protein ComEC
MGGSVAGVFREWRMMRAIAPSRDADLTDTIVVAHAGHGRVVWAPVALTFGIWAYFALPVEPGAAITLISACSAVFLLRLANGKMAATMISLALVGFVAAKMRTELVHTPLLASATGEVLVVGLVHDVDQRSPKRYTLTLEPTSIEGLLAADLPRRITMAGLVSQGTVQIGDRVAARARLFPISGPVAPGSFDYARQLYFAGIGGNGRIVSDITRLGVDEGPRMWPSRFLSSLRREIGSRISAQLEGTKAAVAEALITGERASIPRAVNQSMQISGLAHILSISGLHMSLAAGGVYWLVRALLALWPRAALRWPIKKWAAGAALGVGFLYMELAGAAPATQRSYIMIAVVFFAIIVDRPAISLRNLALAAILILLLQPESAIQASFQMSFMAVLGLAAMYEWWGRWRGEPEYRIESKASRMSRKVMGAILASIATSVVAGGFSSVPAAFHFGRIAPYGVLANGLAIPAISLVVMPSAIAAIIAMPLGLEAWPLLLMGKGLDLVMSISDWVGGLPGARSVLPQMPLASAVLIAMGLVVLCLAEHVWKLLFLPCVVAGLAVVFLHGTPDVLIDRTASAVAYRDPNGVLIVTQSRPAAFAISKWLQLNGEEATPKDALARSGWQCSEILCSAMINGKKLVYLKNEKPQEADCAGADVLIAASPLRGVCREIPLRIDRFDVWRHGAYALTIRGEAITVSNAQETQGARPWVMVPKPRKKPQT